MNLSKRAIAEFLGTFWLVFGGCGSAVLAAAFPQLGIGFYGVALAFGLTVLTMAYAIGHISGCHLNPAVSIGLVAGKRFPVAELLPYIIAQVIGGIAGAGVLYVIASGKAGFDVQCRFRIKRLRCTLTWRLFAGGMPCCGSGAYFLFPDDHYGGNGPACSSRLCADRNRTGIDADSSDRNPGDESLSEPRTEYRAGHLCWGMGTRTTLVILGSAHLWRRGGRSVVRCRVRVANCSDTDPRS